MVISDPKNPYLYLAKIYYNIGQASTAYADAGRASPDHFRRITGPKSGLVIPLQATIRHYRSWKDNSYIGSHVAMDLKEVMATNLRRLRHEKGLTQEGLAEAAGISVRYVGAIERAKVAASVTVLGHIADALHVAPGDLVTQSIRMGRRS